MIPRLNALDRLWLDSAESVVERMQRSLDLLPNQMASTLSQAVEASRRFTQMLEANRMAWAPTDVTAAFSELIDRSRTDRFVTTPASLVEAIRSASTATESLADAMRARDRLFESVRALDVSQTWLRAFAFPGPIVAAVAEQGAFLEPFEREVEVLLRESPRDQRDSGLRTLFLAAFEVLTGADATSDAPHKRLARWLALLQFLFTIILALQSQQQIDRLQFEVKDLRRLQKQDQAALGALVEVLRELQEQGPVELKPPTVKVRANARGAVRESPTGTAPRVFTTKPGQILEQSSTFDRWLYVTLLDADGRPTELAGWIYRRSVTVAAP